MHPWNKLSAVTCCNTCEGNGRVYDDAKRATIHNPYPERECDDCDGAERTPECEVCGCEIVVPGYDCIVCQTVVDLPASELTDAAIANLASAFGVAIKARRDAERKLAA